MKVGFIVTRPLMPGQYVMEIDPARNIGIERVIFNAPATIVIWKDGSKTVVKCTHENYDPEKGLAMAIAKKALGNKGSYYSVFKKWLPKSEEESNDISSAIEETSNKNTIDEYFPDFRTAAERFAKVLSKIGKKPDEEGSLK